MPTLPGAPHICPRRRRLPARTRRHTQAHTHERTRTHTQVQADGHARAHGDVAARGQPAAPARGWRGHRPPTRPVPATGAPCPPQWAHPPPVPAAPRAQPPRVTCWLETRGESCKTSTGLEDAGGRGGQRRTQVPPVVTCPRPSTGLPLSRLPAPPESSQDANQPSAGPSQPLAALLQ